MESTNVKVKLILVEELLGTQPNDPELHTRFIADKAPDAQSRDEEIATLGAEEVEERGITVFPRVGGRMTSAPFVYDYQIRGYLKESCAMLKRARLGLSNSLTMYKKVIDGQVFVAPRQILLQIPAGEGVGECQRPLRAQTAQGERVALAHSETVPAGTKMEFVVKCLGDASAGKGKRIDLTKAVVEWLDYGELHGIGQWRNSGKGKFLYRATLGDEVIGQTWTAENAEMYGVEALPEG